MKVSPAFNLDLSASDLKMIAEDPVKSAECVNLEYIPDHHPGITRKRKGKSFQYYQDKKRISDIKILNRIKKLAIPPAWENVWICCADNGHLQATGFDKKNIKQYRYHQLWSQLRNETKFNKLNEFGKALPLIREQLEKDISHHGMPIEKVLAAVVMIMERTHIRIGNSFYEKLYGSFGITTLKDGHVKIKGNEAKFKFKGKKGVEHSIALKSNRLVGILRKCIDVPGNKLFQYYDNEGRIHSIDSGMVNNYIRKLSGNNFSSKDFRTWEGSIHALLAIKKSCIDNVDNSKNKTVAILDHVASELGNTRTVCKKYYVHPLILELHENNMIDKYIRKIDSIESYNGEKGLLPVEKVLMQILRSKYSKIN